MLLHVKGRHVEVSDSLRGYAEEKFGKLKLQRQLPDPTKVEIEFSLEHNPAIAEACDWVHEMQDGLIVGSHPRRV